MTHQDPFATIALDDLSRTTGGFNPFKSAWNEAKKVGHKVVDTAKQGIDYVKQHPELFQPRAPLY